MKKNIDINFYLFVLFLFLFIGASILFISSVLREMELANTFFLEKTKTTEGTSFNLELGDIKQFSSEEEFLSYLSRSRELQEYYGMGRFPRAGGFADEIMIDSEMMMEDSILAPSMEESAPERYSETNIQVEGVDEPDILKTDGVNLFFSQKPQRYYYWREDLRESATKIIKGFPHTDLKLLSEIDEGGNLFLRNDILVIFQDDKILGYNVKEKTEAKKIWEVKINENTAISSARLSGETIYLVIINHISRDNPCIIRPLTFNERDFEISCTDIYYPGKIIPVDSTYTAIKINLNNGEKEDSVSFIGANNTSITYMSHSNLYLSYFRQAEMLEFISGFFRNACSDIISEHVISRLEKLDTYDISSMAKMMEMEVILSEYFQSLDKDKQLEIENEITNRADKYYEEKRRELESTGIVKINLSNLEIEAVGSVPGNLLNQFALDEYNGNLRVATTVGERFFWSHSLPGRGTRSESANDVYVLDKDLNQLGVVKNLGMDERIYAVRFIGDMGYVVTFREIDPFYILDLSNPTNPQMKGELKIPGYSSYLHPINENRMLGIGMENWNVKASLFDISNPSNPREIDNYKLSENWSEAVNNHHAFLMDKKHEIFFLPAGQGGYVFSYKNDKISLQRAVKESNVQRALYIDDYLYIVSNNKVIVLDQNTWERVKELDL